MRHHLSAEVSIEHADISMLLCCFISGLVDSTVYNAYGTFVSMQTGNTIFLGLGGAIAHRTSKPYGWAKSFTSIVCFCFGCFTFCHLSRFLGPLRRRSLVASFFAQTVIILAVATFMQVGVVNGRLDAIGTDIDWKSEIPIALLSFQSAGQIVGSRTLKLAEIPSVVVTSMLHDLVTDPKFWSSLQSNAKRNRRVCAFVGILVGAVAGGFISEATQSVSMPLWLAGGLKMAITIAWIVWPKRKSLPA